MTVWAIERIMASVNKETQMNIFFKTIRAGFIALLVVLFVGFVGAVGGFGGVVMAQLAATITGVMLLTILIIWVADRVVQFTGGE